MQRTGTHLQMPHHVHDRVCQPLRHPPAAMQHKVGWWALGAPFLPTSHGQKEGQEGEEEEEKGQEEGQEEGQQDRVRTHPHE